jgi:hypothetical protein
MRARILGIVLVCIAVFSYLILHETDNLALIEQTAEKSRYTILDTESFVLPESTKITNKDKTTTEVLTTKQITDAYLNAKRDNILYIGYEKNIYSELFASFGFAALLFTGIGGLVGYWLRNPIDGYDFEALRAKTEQEVSQAWEETRKAQETARNAQIEALKQAREELEHEKSQAEYQRQEAEKERRSAIQAQQRAEQVITQANAERDEALSIADIATRKKNASFAAAERFKRRTETSSRA